MKKAISFLAVLLIAATAFATPRLVSFSNKGGKTTVVFTLSADDRDSSNGLGIDKIVLECNGKTYTCPTCGCEIRKEDNDSHCQVQENSSVEKRPA